MGKWTWFTKSDAEEMTEEISRMEDEEDNSLNRNFEIAYKKDRDAHIGINIYPNDGSVKDFSEKSTFVHKILKSSFIDVLLKKFMKSHRDKLLKTVPEGYQFEDLKLFKESYDEALKEWCYKYQFVYKDEKGQAVGIINPEFPGMILAKPKCAEELKKCYEETKEGRLGFAGEAYVTLCAFDSAYLEFNSFLMRALQKRLKNLNPEHLLYMDTNINDPKYFIPIGVWDDSVMPLIRQLMAGNIRFVEILTSEDGNVTFKVDFKKIPSFVRKENLPEEVKK